MLGPSERFRKSSLGCVILSLIASLGAGERATAEEYAALIAEAPLPLVLRVVGQDLGVDFSYDGPKRQWVRNLPLRGSKQQVIQTLLQETEMVSFTFNGTVFVSSLSEQEVRLVRLGDLTTGQALQALEAAGLMSPKFGVQEVAGGSALALTGPVKYLAIAESVIASTVPPKPKPQQLAKVRVRRAGKMDDTE